MPQRYHLTRTAFRSLDQEIEYSKHRWGAAHAKAYKRDLLAMVRKISQHPELYEERPEIGPGIRCVRFKGNYIVYRLNDREGGIIVLDFPSVHTSRML